jgi:hypothetical protein
MSKILYQFSFTDPNNVGAWPPSIENSPWLANLASWLRTNDIGNGTVIFDSEEALNDWLNTYKLTDAALLADLDAWKTAHNVAFTYKYYQLSDFNPSISNVLD